MPIQTLYTSPNCEWIDCESATAQDFEWIQNRFNINPLLLEDTIDVNHLPKYDEDGKVKFILMRENVSNGRNTLNSASDITTKLSIFILENTIITIHRLKNPSIEGVRKRIEISHQSFSPDLIALHLALLVIKSYDNECLGLMNKLDQMETEIFLKTSTRERDYLRRLYKVKRKTSLNIRILNISSEWVNQYSRLQISHAEFTDLKDKYKDVVADFEHLGTEVNNLISMFLALSDQKANQVMKVLAIYSVYFLPITFIAGLYGMNFDNMPELHNKWGYFITLGIMALIVLATFIYFRKKKWG